MDASYITTPRHAVAVIGGACAGAEAAEILAKAGCFVTVIEQNDRPFGKIEDGLPRWHARQRAQEYKRIGGKLTTDGVTFVPRTRIGRDIGFDELRGWGFSAIVLASGAWRDRPLRVDGADKAEGRGLVYQNPFIYWFNHHEEASFEGEDLSPRDGAIIVGGGLASIDVVKATMLETVAAKLRERGHEIDVVHMEHKGIARILAGLELTLDDLGIEGCTLVYRRSAREMPLAQFKPGADEESKEKTRSVRERLMRLTQEKFLCKFSPNTLPKALSFDEEGNVNGLVVVSTRTEGRKVIELEGTERTLPTSLVFSSIGSLPRPIEGIPMDGDFYDYDDWDLGRVKDMPETFGVGNVVTGQGNIAISRKHARKVSDVILAEYLGVGEKPLDEPAGVLGAAEGAGADAAEAVQQHLEGKDPLTVEQLSALADRIHARQDEVGYDGNFDAWIEAVTPPDRT